MASEKKFSLSKLAQDLRRHFLRVRRAEKQYMIQLMRVARATMDLIKGFETARPGDLYKMEAALEGYARVLEPWARAVSKRMLNDVTRRDERAWHEMGEQMGRQLRKEIEGAPIGGELQRLQTEQIAEIQSIPRAAAEHVREMANEAMIAGGRSSEIAKTLKGVLGLTEARACMVARAAVNGASTGLMQTRAQYVGSPGYIWRTSGDGEVRSDHKRLNGQFFKWDEPPIVDQRTGFRSHPGCNAGCRCWAEVILPEEDE